MLSKTPYRYPTLMTIMLLSLKNVTLGSRKKCKSNFFSDLIYFMRKVKIEKYK